MSEEEKNIELPIASALGREEQCNFNFAIYGDHGSGKTAWTEEILLANKKRLFIVDTTGHDYGQEAFCKASHIHYDAIITDIREASKYVVKPEFRIVIRAHEREMEALSIFQWDEQKKSCLVPDCTVVVEEIHRFMDAQSIEPELENIITLGRHSRLNFVGVAQIPRGQTNLLYRSQMDMFISFRQTEESVVKFFNDFDQVKAEKLRDLERGRYEIFRGSQKGLLEFIKNNQ